MKKRKTRQTDRQTGVDGLRRCISLTPEREERLKMRKKETLTTAKGKGKSPPVIRLGSALLQLKTERNHYI
jgi:hypothetical protein